jgi:hypothetical protein
MNKSVFSGWQMHNSFLAAFVRAIDGAEEAEFIETHCLPEQEGM